MSLLMMMRNSRCYVSLVLALMVGVCPSHAAAETAVMIEAGNQALRDDIQWLIDRGVIDLTSSTWPLPLASLETAVANYKKKGLSAGDTHALISVRHYIEQQRRSSFGVVAQLNSAKIPQTGFAGQSRSQGSGGLYIQGGGDGFAGKLQVNRLLDPLTSKQSSSNFEGSYVAATFLDQVVYAGQIAHFWGPGQDGSLNWGNAGTAIPGIGLQRSKQTAPESKFLSWVGPWGYDLFVGQLQHDTAVPDARVLNMRLFARPISGLEVGLSRFIEWGGEGRDNGLGAVWNSLVGKSNDTGPGAHSDNQLAGFDIRYTTAVWGNPLTVYTQLAGEDEAGFLPSRYLGQIGAQFKHMLGSSRLQWYVEGADTQTQRLFGLRTGIPGSGYNHSQYTNGLYHDGLPIGHWAGGSGKVYSAGVSISPLDYKYYSKYTFRVLHAEVNSTSSSTNFAFPKSDSFIGGEFAVDWVVRPVTLRAGVSALKSRSGNLNNAFGVMVSVIMPLSRL